MTDLSNGIIDVGGFVITPNTTRTDFENLPADKVKIDISKRGNKYFTLLTPVVSGGISMYIEPHFKANGALDSLTLNPKIPVGMPHKDQRDGVRNALACSKIWLKQLLGVIAPSDEDADCLCYSFNWGHIIAAIYKDRDYEIRGGNIEMRFI